MENKTGIWVDFEKAFIIEANNEQESITKIESNIEHFNAHGGPQDNVSETRLLERNLHQQKEFFSNVINKVKPNNEIVIFGPAEAKINLKKEFQNHNSFKGQTIPVETSDNMTENQMIAWVKEYSH
ncbi:MAG: hypothetical protein ACJASF_002421 [Vicingaceae bacterium]|jgi:hypothetical protein